MQCDRNFMQTSAGWVSLLRAVLTSNEVAALGLA